MSVEGMFMCVAGVVFLLLACKDGWNLWKNKGKTGDATGTVMEVYTSGNGRNPKAVSYTHLDVYKRQGKYCLVLEKKSTILGESDVAVRVPITVLKSNSQYVAIDDALTADDRIITGSSKNVSEGDRVRAVSYTHLGRRWPPGSAWLPDSAKSIPIEEFPASTADFWCRYRAVPGRLRGDSDPHKTGSLHPPPSPDVG